MNNSPEKISLSGMERVIGYVRDMVASHRKRGIKTEYAIPAVAADPDLTPKRAKSIFYRDGIWKMARDEAERIERAFADHLDREIALSIEYTEQLRIKRDQLTMGLSCVNESCSPHGAGYESTGLRVA